MNIADKAISLITFAVSRQSCNDTSFVFYQFCHLCTTDDITAHVLDIIHQGAHNQSAVALQSPTALDIALLAMGKGQ